MRFRSFGNNNIHPKTRIGITHEMETNRTFNKENRLRDSVIKIRKKLHPKTENKKDTRQSSGFIHEAVSTQIEKNETGSRIRSMFMMLSSN